jgi:ribonuclease-3
MADDIIANEEGDKLYNPWNPVNKLIDDQAIKSVLALYGFDEVVKDYDIFRRACVHKSYTVFRPENQNADALFKKKGGGETKEVYEMAERPTDCLPLQEFHNEELEFVGDSILDTVVALYIYTRYCGMGEGFLTKLKIKIVNNKTLGEIAKSMGLPKWLVISRHVEDACYGRSNMRICGSILEAWIGALYFHCGAGAHAYDVCQRWLTAVMDAHIDFAELISEDKNYKDILLRFYQQNWHTSPRYKLIEEIGPIHDRSYVVGVEDVKGVVISKASSRTKKVAEQEASRRALVYFGAL